MWPPPRIVVSACLGLAAVRYNGGLIPDPVVEALKTHAHLIPVCPEVAIGLSVPRPAIRLVQEGKRLFLIQPEPSPRDLTGEMEAFSQTFLEGLQVEGFILKNRSPSCALKDARVYGPKGEVLGRGAGLFAREVLRRFPLLPVEEEGRLSNPVLRAQFFTRVFGLARLRRVETLQDLRAFHARYKLLLMAQSPKETLALGRLIAQGHKTAFPQVLARYQEGFLRATLHPPRPGGLANALQHAFGYFKRGLSQKEKAHFLALLEEVRKGRTGPEAPLALLRSWSLRFGEAYLEGQALLEPFPQSLRHLPT
ncbi:DUF523 and DUF1722 domain-containing protein [Thermus sp.]|uniref:YbgA family protein n=1 Tax=Thermus sp. TaxID=275 RepID=UPI00332AF546